MLTHGSDHADATRKISTKDRPQAALLHAETENHTEGPKNDQVRPRGPHTKTEQRLHWRLLIKAFRRAFRRFYGSLTWNALWSRDASKRDQPNPPPGLIE